MEEKQALEVLKQGISLALSNGGFKSPQDVAVVNTALMVFERGIEERENNEKAVKNLPTSKKSK